MKKNKSSRSGSMHGIYLLTSTFTFTLSIQKRCQLYENKFHITGPSGISLLNTKYKYPNHFRNIIGTTFWLSKALAKLLWSV